MGNVSEGRSERKCLQKVKKKETEASPLLLFFSREKLLETDFFCRGDEASARRGQQQTQLEMDGDNGVYRWHLLCLLFLFLSAFST